MSTEATLTCKGRTTIPKSIRDSLRMKAGDRMSFTLMPDGVVLMRVNNKRVSELAGLFVPAHGGPPPGPDQDIPGCIHIPVMRLTTVAAYPEFSRRTLRRTVRMNEVGMNSLSLFAGVPAPLRGATHWRVTTSVSFRRH